MFVLSEDLDFALFSYNINNKNIDTILKGNINEEIGRKQDSILYTLDLMKNFLLISSFKNIFKLICVNNEMRIVEKYHDFTKTSKFIEVCTLPSNIKCFIFLIIH